MLNHYSWAQIPLLVKDDDASCRGFIRSFQGLLYSNIRTAKSRYRWRYLGSKVIRGKEVSVLFIFLYISEGKFAIYSCCSTGKQNIFCSPERMYRLCFLVVVLDML